MLCPCGAEDDATPATAQRTQAAADSPEDVGDALPTEQPAAAKQAARDRKRCAVTEVAFKSVMAVTLWRQAGTAAGSVSCPKLANMIDDGLDFVAASERHNSWTWRLGAQTRRCQASASPRLDSMTKCMSERNHVTACATAGDESSRFLHST